MLVAAVSSDEFLGYTAYRMSGDRAILIHLCVMEEARRRNVAKLLIDHVKQITKQKGLRGIGLSCRVDFDANDVWPRLGFSPRGERRGKKKDGSVLKLWWFDHGLPDLFSLAAAAGHDDGTMHIRACSRVVTVNVGPATNLYRQNEHLGVFIWENVRDLAKGNAHASVMAFRFADTEVFRRPIPLAEAKLAGVRSNLPSPLAISDELFATLYRRGMGQIQ